MGGACSRRTVEYDGPLELVPPSCPPSVRRVTVSRHSGNSMESNSMNCPSLLNLSVRLVAQGLGPYQPLHRLPPDLAQLLFNHLCFDNQNHDQTLHSKQAVCASTLGAFSGCFLRAAHLSGHSNLEDSWLRLLSLHHESLTLLDCATCHLVTDAGLAHLQSCLRLEELDFTDCCQITDAGLMDLKALRSLRTLTLSGCSLLTGAFLPSLSALPSLRHLSLDRCPTLSFLGPLPACTSLSSLNLGWCRRVGDGECAAIGQLGGLTRLQMARTKCGDEGVGRLRGLTNLEELELGQCPISNKALEYVAAFSQLTRLDVERCGGVSCGGLQSIQALPCLTHLNVGYSGVGLGLPRLQGFKSLQTLDLESCRLENGDLINLRLLPSITSLDLSDTAISDDGLRHLSGMTNLVNLNLSCSKVTNAGLPAVRGLHKLQKLGLDTRHVSDVGLATITSLTGLTHLDLFSAQITDVGAKTLCNFPQLRKLELCGGHLSDAGVAHLQTLSSLQTLNLAQNTKITDAALQNLMSLPRLEYLNVSGSGVSIQGLSHLCHIWHDQP